MNWRPPISATVEQPRESDDGELRCYRHPDTPTRLRCNRCGRPICTRCATPTPVGLRCPECAQGPRPVIYQTEPTMLVTAVGGGLVVAIIIGVLWGLLNRAGLGPRAPYDWGFWFTLLLGFGTTEAISFLAKRRRGPVLQGIGTACIVLGFLISRVVLNFRLARPFSLSDLLGSPLIVGQSLGVTLFWWICLALACAIAWRRFL